LEQARALGSEILRTALGTGSRARLAG
jgi:hypothetical protein